MITGVNSTATAPPQAAESQSYAETAGLTPAQKMLVLMVYSEMTRSDVAETSIEVSSEQLERLKEEVRRAMQAAYEAEQDAGFWGSISNALNGDVAALCEVVAIAAASVVTGGTAALVLGAIAIGATLASKYADELGIPKEAAIGLGISAGLLTMGAGSVGSAASALGSLSEAAKTTKLCLQVSGAVATAGGAIAGGMAGRYQADVLDHQADAQAYQSAASLESSSIDENLRFLQRSLDGQLFAAQESARMVRNEQQSTTLMLQNFRGAA